MVDWRDAAVSREVGSAWLESRSEVALRVPSIVAQPWGWNVLLNPSHSDFAKVTVTVLEAVDVSWDARLGAGRHYRANPNPK